MKLPWKIEHIFSWRHQWWLITTKWSEFHVVKIFLNRTNHFCFRSFMVLSIGNFKVIIS